MQGGRACVEALLILGRLGSAPADFDAVPPVELAPFDRCVRVTAVAPGGYPATIMGQVDLRLDPADAGFAAGPDGRHQLGAGWTCPVLRSIRPRWSTGPTLCRRRRSASA